MSNRRKTVVAPSTTDSQAARKRFKVEDPWEREYLFDRAENYDDKKDGFTNAQIHQLKKERDAIYEAHGIAEDHSIIKLDEIVKNIKVARDKLPNFRK